MNSFIGKTFQTPCFSFLPNYPIVLDSVLFINCQSFTAPLTIMNNNANITINETSFISCSSTKSGAIYAVDFNYIEGKNLVFNDCLSKDEGNFYAFGHSKDISFININSVNSLNSDQNHEEMEISMLRSAKISQFNSTNNPIYANVLLSASDIKTLTLDKWNIKNGLNFTALNIEEFIISDSYFSSLTSIDFFLEKTNLSFKKSTLLFDNETDFYFNSADFNLSFTNCHLSSLNIPNAQIEE